MRQPDVLARSTRSGCNASWIDLDDQKGEQTMNDANAIGRTVAERLKAGHYEALGETLAKFEFFQHGWHPYSRFLDVDKIDLILRRRRNTTVYYREVQVKFGKLYKCTRGWEQGLFADTSWRFFKESEIAKLAERPDVYVAYILSPDDGFKGDMFVFRCNDFVTAIRSAFKVKRDHYNVYVSRSAQSPNRWFVRRRPRLEEITPDTTFEVSRHYRDFRCLEPDQVR